MFKAIGAIFNMLFTLAGAGNRLAIAADHLASIAEDEALGLKAQMQVERTARLAEAKKALQA